MRHPHKTKGSFRATGCLSADLSGPTVRSCTALDAMRLNAAESLAALLRRGIERFGEMAVFLAGKF